MKPIRVLHVVGNLGWAGVEAVIMNYYHCIDRSKVQFDFIVTSTNKQKYEDEVNSMGGKIYRLHSRARSTLKYIKELNSLFQENPEYKIIHAHSGSANITIDLAVAKKNKIPVRIAHSHNTSCNNQAQHYILKHFLKKWATHSFACSNSAGVWMFGSNTKFDIVKNGIDLSKFCYNNETRSKVRNSLDIDNNLLLISVGALRAAKNQMYLLDIFNEILKINDNAKLLVVGEGSCRGDLEEKIREFNLNNKAYLLGNRNDVNELLQGADAFILPSAYEGQPVVKIEALASSLPIFASDNVTNEADIPGLVYHLPLKLAPDKWAEYIIDHIYDNTRHNTSEVLGMYGYDIKQESKKLENFYIQTTI